jgi:NAD(P)-dependent dehydrogenase (short-subunit alcohol dehydrogenase family)
LRAVRTVAELFRLDGRVALITGGAGHIGLACGEALAELGAKLVIVDREQAACDARAQDLAARFGVEAVGLVTELENTDACKLAITATVSRLGRLDVLVNNAAYTGASNIQGYAVPLPAQSIEAWEAALRVNLTAPFVLAQAAFAELAKHQGAIVNVGSIYGSVGPQNALYEGTAMGNPAAYAATKGGLAQLTRYLATSMAPAVRVNCLSPGGVARGQAPVFVERYVARTPLGRMASEEDFKGAFAYLASPASAYVTGQELLVDGGWTAW